MIKNPEDAKCVVCNKEDSGCYGDTEICVCLDCYKNGSFRKWLNEKGIE